MFLRQLAECGVPIETLGLQVAPPIPRGTYFTHLIEDPASHKISGVFSVKCKSRLFFGYIKGRFSGYAKPNLSFSHF
jgi:hypothetical protein